MHETKLMPEQHQLHLARIARIGHAYFKPLILAATHSTAPFLQSERVPLSVPGSGRSGSFWHVPQRQQVMPTEMDYCAL
ncbi:hypothetical protein EN871_28190 [bacterium M00.F.Ca.ET.228.01.1.1]|nr:hypothetical protein EN871_28190 [bacterium M00.F.Ca.ET.228.01.1.1]TGR96282.1 hypothetical protein EN834_28760 [bacterium M00.F.Ca.ET.191.01.1.1]TGT97426.1 hypothetical protein EN798_28545 [bacterium M00.F.Ca.ET.155.01.1.1]